ncbi:hypothetical protein D3C85_931020 [compost metagenome]
MGRLHAVVGLERAFPHELHRIAGAGLERVDHVGDLVGGVLHPPGQIAHLVRHHGETPAHLAGAGRLDGGIERQQVGLLGDAVDDVDHAVDLLAVLGQALDHLGGLLHAGGEPGDGLLDALHHHLSSPGQPVGILRLVAGVRGVLGDVVDGGRHLVDGGGGLVGFALLAEHALAHLAHAAGKPGGAFVEAGNGLGHCADHTLVAALHGIEGTGHLAHFVAAVQRNAGGEVAAAFDVEHHVLEGVEVAEQEADQQLRGRQQRDHQQQHGSRVLEGALAEQLDQARAAGQHGDAFAVATVEHLGADQRVAAEQAVLGQFHPAAGLGQGLAAGQLRSAASAEGNDSWRGGQGLAGGP